MSEPIILFPDDDEDEEYMLLDPKNLLPKEIWLVPEEERPKQPVEKVYTGSIDKDIFTPKRNDSIV